VQWLMKAGLRAGQFRRIRDLNLDYPATAGDLHKLAAALGPIGGYRVLGLYFWDAVRWVEIRVPRFGVEYALWQLGPKLSRRECAGLLLMLPRRYRRAAWFRLRHMTPHIPPSPAQMLWAAWYAIERRALKAAFGATIHGVFSFLDRRSAAAVLRRLPKRYRRPVLRRMPENLTTPAGKLNTSLR
jgi:hypothetical protein